MGWFDTIFGSRQNTETSNTSTSSTSNNANNDARFQGFWDQYAKYASNPTGAQTAINDYQTNAANQLQTAGSFVLPGINTASQIAATGPSISTAQMWMSPYTQNVVDATRADFDTQNARDIARTNSRVQSMQGPNGSGGVLERQLARESQRRTQDPIIAGLYDKGWTQAVGQANQTANTQLAGVNAQYAGANAVANTGQAAFGAGQQIWQDQYKNNQSPYDVLAQMSSGWNPFLSAAGQTTNASGTQNSLTTSAPSPWKVGMNILGSLPFMGVATGGRIDAPAEFTRLPSNRDHGHGNAPRKEFHHRVMEAFDAVHQMRSRGGSVLPAYNGGGVIPDFETTVTPAPGVVGADPNWTAEVKKEPNDFQKFVAKQNAPGGLGYDQDLSAAAKVASDSQRQLMDWQSRVMPRADGGEVEGFADGGGPRWSTDGGLEFEPRDQGYESPMGLGMRTRDVGERPVIGQPYGPAERFDDPAPAEAPDNRTFLGKAQDYMKSFFPKAEGITAGREMTPFQRTGVMLSALGDMDVKGGALGLSKDKLDWMAADRDAQRVADQLARTQQAEHIALGYFPGKGQTIAGRAQSEAETTARLPEYAETGKTDWLGNKEKAWVNRRNAPPEAMAPAPDYGPNSPRPGAPGVPGVPRAGAGVQPQPPVRGMEVRPNGPATGDSPDRPMAAVTSPQEEQMFAEAYPGKYYVQKWTGRVVQAPDRFAPAPDPQQPRGSAANPVMVGRDDQIEAGTHYMTPNDPTVRIKNPDGTITRYAAAGTRSPNAEPLPAQRPPGPPLPPRTPQAGPPPPAAAPAQQPPAAGPPPPGAPPAPGQQPAATAPAAALPYSEAPAPPATPGVVPVNPGSNMDMNFEKQGMELYNALPKPVQMEVDAALSGRKPPPSGSAKNSTPNQRIMMIARAVDPTFDEALWGLRHKTYLDYSPGGKVGTQLSQASTAINHFAEVDKLAKKLQNSNIPFSTLVRHITNPIVGAAQQGEDGFAARENAFSTAADLAVKEAAKFLSGGQGGGVEERKALLDKLSSAKSYPQLKAAIHTIIEQMGGRAEPLATAYNRVMNTDRTKESFYSPDAQENLKSLHGHRTEFKSKTPIGQMGFDEINALPLDKLSDEQLAQTVARRQKLYDEKIEALKKSRGGP